MSSVRTRTRASRSAGVLACVLVAASCGGDDNDAATESITSEAPSATGSPAATDPDRPATDPPATDPPATDARGADPGADGIRSVPDEYKTIQAAVDAAAGGEIVLIGPGTYVEAVDVTTDELTIRGLERDTVVLDGGFELDNGIRVLGADGVVVENLTVTNYTNNGVFWVTSEGYRASYVTTYRTGDYGIYAFDSVNGQIEHSHTVGSDFAGIYVGQCFPCDAVIADVVSSHNGLGYSGTNSGGNLLIVRSDWHDNRAGILPNSGSYELCYPERETTIVGNRVWRNNGPAGATDDGGSFTTGNGILIAGGIGNVVERNRVDDHVHAGIGLVPFVEETPNDDLPTEEEWALTCDEQKEQPFADIEEPLLWDPYDNVVIDNVVTGSGDADLVVATAGGDISTLRNCFAGNAHDTSAPEAIESLAPCEGSGSGDWTAGDLGVDRWFGEQAEAPGEVPWQDAPLPELGAHENMPDPAGSPARPATDVPFPVDLDAITVPQLPEG